MKPKKIFSCFCVLAVCICVLFVSACGPRLYPIAKGTYLWENVLKIQEMPFSNVKLDLAEIDKEAFDEAEGVNVGCADLAPREPTEQGPTVQPIAQELTYFSFELCVFAEAENAYVQIDVVNFKQMEGGISNHFDTLDSSKSYGITDMEFYSVLNDPADSVPFSWLSLKFYMQNDPDRAQEASQAWFEYDLRPSSDPLEKGTYYWDNVLQIQKAPFPNVKLVLSEIDKETFEQAEGVNVFFDESPSAKQKYYSFELYLFEKDVNDFVPIDIVGFDWQNGSTFYYCETVDPSKSYGIADIHLVVHSKSYSTSDYYISLTITSDDISDTTEEPSREYFHDSYSLKRMENEGENL